MSAPSAKGISRATGKTAKPVAMRDFVTGDIVKSAEGLTREKDEFYPTPPEPTQAFLHAEMACLQRFNSIWEPAAADGAMVREMEACGLSVHASDLIDRGCGAEIRSFYDFSAAPAPAIVTNPPFAECGWGNGKARWLRHALETLGVEYMALLLSWNWPGAGGLAPFWGKHAPARVYLMRWKIDFTGQGASPMLNAWFVWDGETPETETRLLMLDRKDARQGSLFEEGGHG